MAKRSLLIILLLGIYGLVPWLLRGNDYLMGLVVSACVIAGLALAWALLSNLGGMVSFGHAAFFGVGAYTSALLVMQGGLPVFAGVLLGGVGAVLAALVTLPALRLRGAYFALAILAFAHIFRILAIEFEGITGGAGGLLSIPRLPEIGPVDFSSKQGGYFVIVTIVLLSLFVYQRLRSSHYGLALKAMHDSELATRMLGVPSTLLKACMLGLSAFIAGVIGAFNAHFINFLEPDYAFSGDWSVLPIVAAVFGGYRTLSGPVLGALVIYLLDQLLFKEILPHGHHLVLGVLLGMMILLSPEGLLPWLRNLLARWSRARVG